MSFFSIFMTYKNTAYFLLSMYIGKKKMYMELRQRRRRSRKEAEGKDAKKQKTLLCTNSMIPCHTGHE